MRRVHIPKHHDAQHGAPAPYARPLGLLYAIVVLRTLTANSLAVFLPVLLTQQGMGVGEASAAVSLYLFVSTVGGFLGGPLADAYGPRRVIIWTLVTSVPFLLLAQLTVGLDTHGARLDRRAVPAVDAADQRHVRPADRAGERGDGVVADDGLRLGRRLAAGAVRRSARGRSRAADGAGDQRSIRCSRRCSRCAAADRAEGRPGRAGAADVDPGVDDGHVAGRR